MEKTNLKPAIKSISKIFKKYHLSYDQAIYVCKQARRDAQIKGQVKNIRKIERLSKEEQRKLITAAYKKKGNTGILIKTLFLTGTRVSEFVQIKVSDFYFDENCILIRHGKGGKQRTVPIIKHLSEEINSYLAGREQGYLFESRRNDKYTSRRIQQIVKSVAIKAGIEKRVHPHLLRHSVATFLLENGMPFEQIQIFLGHQRIENTRIYAKNSAKQIQDEFRKAMISF